ncbi:hypothetical protein EZV62_019174 [Acer yangbiense]|uniref:DDE Tnp4 domain-containing protein n=1 Tax=Acer yangbiense TaxID=1000413 RepID=A0A5C7HAI0_9ROSI|nr:hypothetical protein EZV62_019174 [Acer yangbiense]
MAACDFNMCFTFAWVGWEVAAHDTRIFLEALRREILHFPHPPRGKYYLVDAGYPQMKSYLGLYKVNTDINQEFKPYDDDDDKLPSDDEEENATQDVYEERRPNHEMDKERDSIATLLML